MGKGQTAAILVAALLSASWFSARVTKASVPQPSLQSAPDVAPFLPEPVAPEPLSPELKPKLQLSLDDPEAALYGAGREAERLQIMGEPPQIKATPTIGLLGTLSRFAVSVDDKHHPIVHYYFAQKSVEGRSASSHDARD